MNIKVEQPGSFVTLDPSVWLPEGPMISGIKDNSSADLFTTKTFTKKKKEISGQSVS